MSEVSTIKMTARQFLELGEDPVGVRLELVDGEIAVSPSPFPDHSYVEKMLTIIVGSHIIAKNLGRLYGDVDTLFGKHDVRRPDIIYFSNARLHHVGLKAMEGAPDLCVEIVSPSSETIDRVHKFAQYRDFGIANYWIIDPAEKTAESYVLHGNMYELAAKGASNDVVRFQPFGDLEIPLAQLWHLPIRQA